MALAPKDTIKKPNPFAPASEIHEQKGIFGDARLTRAGFLFRVIEFPMELLCDRSASGQRGPNPTPHDQAVTRPSFRVKPTNRATSDPPMMACPVILTYSGWWFWQRIKINEQRVWSAISWLSLHRSIDLSIPSQFILPADSNAELVHPDVLRGNVEIHFGPGLSIRRFRILIEDQVRYDEIR